MRRLLVLAVLFCLTPPSIRATELTGSFGQEKPPYLWTESGLVRGIELDIVTAAFLAVGYSITPKVLPNRRIEMTFINSRVDFATGLQPGQIPNAYYSDVYLRYSNFAITKESRGIALTTPADLFNYSVAGWQNAYDDLGMDQVPVGSNGKSPRHDFIEFASSEREAKYFFADRVDVILMDKTIYLWFVNKLGKEMKTSVPVVFHDIFPPQYGVRVAFKDSALRDQFNQGLRMITANGTYAKIFDEYLMPGH